MVFASPLFLFAFLPLALALYYLTPSRARNFTLLCLSLAFYGWGERQWVIVMLASIALNWLGALGVEQLAGQARQKWLLAAVIGLNLSALACFKYGDFAIDNLNALLTPLGVAPFPRANLHLPLGISFFTFHAISYVVDVYRKESQALETPLDTALYIALFPQLIAGPIIRYHYIEEQLKKRSPALSDVAYGVQRFVWGLAKKVLVANVVAKCADEVFALSPAQLGFGVAWLGVLAYALQIYFDFSGYSDMAVGLGRMFGFRFPENFNYPYVARSITEFWRRWHISLSSWFRDYLYIPLGGNRVSKARTYVNLITVFLLCGLWHGASWAFVIWGALHGLFLVLERSPLGKALGALPRALQHVYALVVVCVGWVFFRAPDATFALHFLKALAGLSQGSPASHPFTLFFTPAVACAGVIGLVLSTPVAARLQARFESAAPRPASVLLWRFASVCSIFVLFTLSAAYLATRTYNPFIYFRF
ncbi:MAG TPA: MBOAT family protein [Polyangiaceae bacterium]|nr:MBOAT family protein [Polyangiaceae bacterium]